MLLKYGYIAVLYVQYVLYVCMYGGGTVVFLYYVLLKLHLGAGPA